MPTLSTQAIASLLAPYYSDPTPGLLDQLSLYLDLLLKWNARTNLSAIRSPEEIVRRHFGESLFAARHLPACKTLLDLGSGAGFPGLPIALALPAISVTLAESQNKKASFLREVVRTLGIQVEVWADRVERLPGDRLFDVVTLRAVDNPTLALDLARERLAVGGTILHLTSATSSAGADRIFPIPETDSGVLQLLS
jgi:16S rRNA (guanine527-N7)-methyltransferase